MSFLYTYQKTYLMLLDILIRLIARVKNPAQIDAVTRWGRQAHILMNDIIASPPYHLAGNLHDYERMVRTHDSSPRIGGAVGAHYSCILYSCLLLARLCLQQYIPTWQRIALECRREFYC